MTNHTLPCRAHAIGCAVENLRDAHTTDRSPVTEGDGYLADNTVNCLCTWTDALLRQVSTWITLGVIALHKHETDQQRPAIRRWRIRTDGPEGYPYQIEAGWLPGEQAWSNPQDPVRLNSWDSCVEQCHGGSYATFDEAVAAVAEAQRVEHAEHGFRLEVCSGQHLLRKTATNR